MLFCGNHLIVIMNKSHIAMVLIHDDNLVSRCTGYDIPLNRGHHMLSQVH